MRLVAQPVRWRMAQMAIERALPALARKRRQGRHARRKRAIQRQRRRPAVDQRLPALRQRRGASGRGAGGAQQAGFDKTPRPTPRAQITLGQQLLVHLQHGVARQAKLFGQPARRGQARVGRQAAIEHGGAQQGVKLAAEAGGLGAQNAAD